MRKVIFLLMTVCFFTGSASAQFLTFGFKGGMNYSKLKFNDIREMAANGGTYNLGTDDAFQGFHVGAMARLKIFSAYIQPELYFNTAGGSVLVEELQLGAEPVKSIKQIKYNKIDLPVMVGLKFGPLRINAGPVASVVLNENNGIEEIIPNLESLSKSAAIGYQAGFGLDILKFLTLDYRYEGSLSKYGDKLTVAGKDYPLNSRANVHLISLGILFRAR